jgi:hypothetical protein
MINDISYTNDCPFCFNGICYSKLNFKNECNNFRPLTFNCVHREKEYIKVKNE